MSEYKVTGIQFDSETTIQNAMRFETVERQLAYLVDCQLLADKAVREFSYHDWVRLNKIDERDAYEEDADQDGTPVYHDIMWPDYHNVCSHLERKLNDFRQEIRPFIDMKRKILKIPSEIVKPQSPIQWIGTKEQLAKTIDTLVETGCIPKERQYQTFAEHFKWKNPKNGKLEEITNKELSSLANKTPDDRKKVKAVSDGLKSKLSKK